MRYSRSFAAHNEYIVREGTGEKVLADLGERCAGKNKERAKLYGVDADEYRKRMVSKNFRIFLSPEKAGVPLPALTKSFINKLEKHTGYRFYWVAADHYNTAHPHTHILINGKDRNGRDVLFKREVVKTFMREYARDVCTTLAGQRTREEMLEEAERRLEANGFTATDERLKAFMKEDRLDITKIDGLYFPKGKYEKRLEHLRKLKVCEYAGGSYRFTAGWEETLRTMGRYNGYLRAFDDLKYTKREKLNLYRSEQGIKSGKVTKIYKTDEVSDNHAVLLEAVDGRAYFVPLFRKPKAREGDLVEILPKRNEKGRLTSEIRRISGETLYSRVTREGLGSPIGEVARVAAESEARSRGQSRGKDGAGFDL
jgi:hypothetical protein